MGREPTHQDGIPITVICGPLGAGKTTLVNRLLDAPGGRNLAVVVNDMGEVNVDAERIANEGGDVVDLSNGCVCCRLQDDLREQVQSLAETREIDAIVVEASGISEPIPIAQTLTGATGGEPPAGVSLDTMVSVIDAYGFWKAFDEDERLPGSAPDPARPLTDVLVDAIEFCDVLLLNKCDMVPDDVCDDLEAVIRTLQPRATTHRTAYCDVETAAVVETGLFDYEVGRRHQGWKRALAGEHDHESAAEAHGVESFVYQRARPFHPERLDAWLADWDGAIIRAKGFAWVASRPGEVIGVSQAGPSVQAGPIGEWGDDDPETRLVFIGTDLEEERLRSELDACLVSGADDEWTREPFPREAD